MERERTAQEELPSNEKEKDESSEAIKESLSLIEKRSDWIYLNLESEISKTKLFEVIKNIFQWWYYIEWFNFQNLRDYILFTDEDNIPNKLNIWESIKKFDSREFNQYQKRLKKSKRQVTIQFGYIELEEWDLKNPWEQVKMDYDKVLAVLFLNNVIYNIDFDEIQRNIDIQDSKKTVGNPVVIAEDEEPEHGQDAVIEPQISIKKDFTPVENEDWTIDYKRFKCPFPQVKDTSQPILIKKPATHGRYWRRVDGSIEQPQNWKEKNLKLLKWKGTEILEHEDGYHYLMPTQEWYIFTDKDRKINITDTATNSTEIGPKTGILYLNTESFVQFWDIQAEYWIENAQNVTVRNWEVSWYIFSNQWEVVLNRSSSLSWWEIINNNGRVVIEWNSINYATIQSIDWEIEVSYAENTTIIWTNIRIQNARNCKIIWDDVKLDNSYWNNIHAKELEIDKADENTVIVTPVENVSTRIYHYLEQLEKTIQEHKERQNQIEEKVNPILAKEKVKRALEIYYAHQRWEINISKEFSLKQRSALNKTFRYFEESLIPYLDELEEIKNKLNKANQDYELLNSKLNSQQNNYKIKINNPESKDIVHVFYLIQWIGWGSNLTEWNVWDYQETLNTLTPPSAAYQTKTIARIGNHQDSYEITHDQLRELLKSLDTNSSDTRSSETQEWKFEKWKQERAKRESFLSKWNKQQRFEDTKKVLEAIKEWKKLKNWINISNSDRINPAIVGPNTRFVAPVKINNKWIWTVIDLSESWIGIWLEQEEYNDIELENSIIELSFKLLNQEINVRIQVRWMDVNDWTILIWWDFTKIDKDTKLRIIQKKDNIQRVLKNAWLDETSNKNK